MAASRGQHARKLAVILHADVAGSTALVQLDESLAHDRITDAFNRFSQLIARYSGTVHEIRGDALLAEFARASDAVCAAVDFQLSHAGYLEQLDDEVTPEIRIGISLGEVVFADDTVTGAGVVLAQRVEQLAEPGGLCVTGAIHEALPQRMPFVQTSLGERQVKGFEDAVRVYQVALKSGAAVPEAEPGNQDRLPSQTRRLIVAFAAVALVSVGVVLFWLKSWIPQEEMAPAAQTAISPTAKPSIAVLPFTNMSGDPEQEYFADGMTDDLITDLSNISGLSVIARNSVFTYKGIPVNVKKVGEELGVRYVLEGSVRRTEGRLRINAQLIEASSGHHLWAERYDRDYQDVFTIQNEVIGRIVSELEVTLTDREETKVVKIPTNNLEAYDYYLRAEQEGFYTASYGSLRRVLSFYKKAIALDPRFAEAHAGYARTNVEIWRFGYNDLVAGTVARKSAYEAASNALAIDSDNPRAYTVLAILQLVDGRHEEAIESAQRAIRSRPNDSEAHLNLALVLAYSGRTEAGVTAVENALRLNPKPSPGTLLFSGVVFYSNHQYERAIKVLRLAIEIEPTHQEPYLVAAYAQTGQLDLARSELNRLHQAFPISNLALQRVLYGYYKRPEDLEHLIGGLRKAGMPEWPLGLEGRKEDRLSASALGDVTPGRTWIGRHVATGIPFIQEISETGTLAYRSAQSFLAGEMRIEQDMLCQSFSSYLSGHKFCGYVYRNPTGAAETQDEYLYITADAAKYFSLVK